MPQSLQHHHVVTAIAPNEPLLGAATMLPLRFDDEWQVRAVSSEQAPDALVSIQHPMAGRRRARRGMRQEI